MLSLLLVTSALALAVNGQSSAAAPSAAVATSTGSAAAAATSAASLPSSASSIAASTSASAAVPAASGRTLLSALSSNLNTTTFAAAINASSPLLNLTSALSDPSRQLTVLVPPSQALQAAAGSPLVTNTRINISTTESISLLDALLALHVLNGSYSAAAIRLAVIGQSRPGMSTGGASVGTLLSGANVTIYGDFSGNSSAVAPSSVSSGVSSASSTLSASSGSSGSGSSTISGSSSASLSASASSASATATGSVGGAGNATSLIFVNNALVTMPDSQVVGQSYIHQISNILDPFLPLVGLVTNQLSQQQNATFANGYIVSPTWAVVASNATVATPTSSGSASASASASSGLSSSAASSASSGSSSLQPIGPIPGPSTTVAASSAPARRVKRWE